MILTVSADCQNKLITIASAVSEECYNN